MDERIFLFVFAKRKEVQVLTLNQCKGAEVSLKADGWKHTATIDARVWIQYIANDAAYSGPNIDVLRGISHGG